MTRIKVLEGITMGQVEAVLSAIDAVMDEDYETVVTAPGDGTANLWIGYAGTPHMAGERIANLLGQALLAMSGAA